MAEIKDKPKDLPSSNDLDKFNEKPPPQAEIRLGAAVLLNLAHPPKIGETRDVVIRLRCTMTGHEQRAEEGDPTPFCRTRVIAAWELGKPKPDDAQMSIDEIDPEDVDEDEDETEDGDKSEGYDVEDGGAQSSEVMPAFVEAGAKDGDGPDY
jgi:hypothetical protein